MKNIYFNYGDDTQLITDKNIEILNNYKNQSGSGLCVEEIELNSKESIENYLSAGVAISLFENNSVQKLIINLKILKLLDENPDKTRDFISFLTAVSEHQILIVNLLFENIDKNTKNYIQNSGVMNELKKISNVCEAIKIKVWEIDELYECILFEKKDNLNLLINKFNNSYPGLYILAALQNKFRTAFQIKTHASSGMNSVQISKTIGLHSFIVDKELKKIKPVLLEKIEKTLSLLSELEYKLKTGIILEKNFLTLVFLSP